MPIPDELAFDNEDEFNQRFVIPFLHKLGFSVVANYHGASEFGKDLVFAEFDRFGHVRFHAVQTKYSPSISINAMQDLIRDCQQAFASDFTHPQTGSQEKISSFYAVTAGSVGDQAKQHYFNSLNTSFGGNVRLLTGKDLLVLDRWANPVRATGIDTKLAGIMLEMNFNNRQLAMLSETFNKQTASSTKLMAPTSVKIDAIARFLAEPPVVEPQLINLLETYWMGVAVINDMVAFFRQRLGGFRPRQAEEVARFIDAADKLTQLGTKIENTAREILKLLQTQVPAG